jgi:hypothetical protein
VTAVSCTHTQDTPQTRNYTPTIHYKSLSSLSRVRFCSVVHARTTESKTRLGGRLAVNHYRRSNEMGVAVFMFFVHFWDKKEKTKKEMASVDEWE